MTERAIVQEGSMASAIFAIAAMLVLVLPVDAGAQPSCGCRGMRNVKNRLCETRAAQREYDRIAAKLLADEKKATKPILLTQELKSNIKDCVQEAINTVDDAGAQDAAGETKSDCSIEVASTRAHLASSQCIEDSVRKHEEFHRQQCLARENGKWEKVWHDGGPVKSALFDTKFAMTAVDYMAEEHAAYMMEEADLTETLRRLANTCKAAEKTVTVAKDNEVPGKKAGDRYSLDPSVERCPFRPRASPSKCKY
jgi:hypothetical protein